MIRRVGALLLPLLTVLSSAAENQTESNISQLLNAGKTKLFIECYGKGSPSIVVNAGFGVKISDGGWEKVIDAVKSKNQICFYDRANVGQSEKHQGEYDLSTIVEQQNTLLEEAGINPPYLMVGHSYGSYPIKLFNHRYPEKVAGILLVDPSLYGQFKSHISKWDPKNDTYDEETTKWMKRELEPWHGTPNNVESINMRTSSTYIEESKDFGDKPYVLLWRKNAIWTPPETKPEVWHPAVWERIKKSYKVDLKTMQTQSSNMKTTFANTNEHFIHKHEPEIVIKEIEYLLKTIDK